MPNLLEKWREGAIGGLILACLFFLAQWKKADTELKEARLAYENPAVKESVREISTGGAEVTIKRTWKTSRPTFADIAKKAADETDRRFAARESEVTQTTTWKSPVTVTRETASESAPIPVSTIVSPTRTDRYLVTLGMGRLSSDFDGKALFVGYGFKNRLDIQIGLVRHDGTSPWVTTTFRF